MNNQNEIIQQIESGKKPLAVIGLGYVGLPVALEFASKFRVIGFDINSKRVAMMKNGLDPSDELGPEAFQGKNIVFTDDEALLREAAFYVVAVPTPIDQHKNPDLRPLLKACETVGRVISKGDVVVFESTVYPGCTEEDCVPVIQKVSGLQYMDDFKVGYSPERINPGDLEHTLTRITKVVSGCDDDTLEVVSRLYGSIIEAGVYETTSIKVAEASKIIENTQRDLNIALMNELSTIFKKIGINTYEVLAASATKWNFLNFTPGLVGGHCIGVDPYYLTYKANELGIHAKVITAGRTTNDMVHNLIGKEIIQFLIDKDIPIRESRVLVMGVTFKENVADIRNSKVPELIDVLKEFRVGVEAIDPYADPEEFMKEYNIPLSKKPSGLYDVVILAVNHQEYIGHEEQFFLRWANLPTLFYDVKGVYKNKIREMNYLSL